MSDLCGLALSDNALLHPTLTFGLDREGRSLDVAVGELDINQVDSGLLWGVGDAAIVVFAIFTVNVNLKFI